VSEAPFHSHRNAHRSRSLDIADSSCTSPFVVSDRSCVLSHLWSTELAGCECLGATPCSANFICLALSLKHDVAAGDAVCFVGLQLPHHNHRSLRKRLLVFLKST